MRRCIYVRIPMLCNTLWSGGATIGSAVTEKRASSAPALEGFERFSAVLRPQEIRDDVPSIENRTRGVDRSWGSITCGQKKCTYIE